MAKVVYRPLRSMTTSFTVFREWVKFLEIHLPAYLDKDFYHYLRLARDEFLHPASGTNFYHISYHKIPVSGIIIAYVQTGLIFWYLFIFYLNIPYLF